MAISHAVRVAYEAIELMETGHVTLPLPNAAHVTAIKTGQIPYSEVALELEQLLVRAQAAAASSPLPDEPDQNFIDQLVAHTYTNVVYHSRMEGTQ